MTDRHTLEEIERIIADCRRQFPDLTADEEAHIRHAKEVGRTIFLRNTFGTTNGVGENTQSAGATAVGDRGASPPVIRANGPGTDNYLNNQDHMKTTPFDSNDYLDDPPTRAAYIAELKDEIERLRAELAEWRQAASVEAGLRREFKTEIERLRAALRECAKDTYFDDYEHDFKPTAAASVALAALDNEQTK